MTASVYRHKPLPALGTAAQSQVVDEFRRLERWSLNVNYKLQPFTVDNSQAPSRVTLDANLTMPFDRVIGFLNSTNSEPIGGIGNVQEVPDVLLFVGTAELTDWEDESTRRPVALGGSSVTIDAGQHMELRLPGVNPNDAGYTLQLAKDGESLIAVPNPTPDVYDDDTSNSSGVVLIGGSDVATWQRFPDGTGAQPDGLVLNIPAGTSAGILYVLVQLRVTNTSAETGSFSIGVGDGIHEPIDSRSQSYIIPAGFSGALDLPVVYVMGADLVSNLFLRVWFKGTADQAQFNLVTDTANGPHTFSARVNY